MTELGWVLVDPRGRVEGLRVLCRGATTPEGAHRAFTRLKRDRVKEVREGWTVRRERAGDREEFCRLIAGLVQEGASDGGQ